MKILSKLTMSLALTSLLFVGCNSTGTSSSESAAAPQAEVKPKAEITEESLGLRKTDLYSENTTSANKTEYVGASAGTSTRFKRAYQDAPPMIPHDVGDFLPVTASNNACTGCHMPEIAPAMGATPIPKSHFLDMRPKHNYDGKVFSKSIDNMKNETDVKEITYMSNARFNCTQCHAPQSQGNLSVENTFEAHYTREGGEFKSSWNEVIYDDLDTVGKDSALTDADYANENSPAGHLEGGH